VSLNTKNKCLSTSLKHTMVGICVIFLVTTLTPWYLTWLLIAYFWVTEFLFYFPIIHLPNKIKHTYPNYKHGLYFGAHRGGSMEGLENTITNFKKAKELEVSYVELDVCLTKDNQVVVCHDPNLKRLWGVDKEVNQFDYKDLPQILPIVPIHFDFSKYDATEWPDKKIPLFDEVCRVLGNTWINMEMKTRGGPVFEEVYKILKKYNKLNQVVWGTNNYEHSLRLRKIGPEVARFACATEFIWVLIYYFTNMIGLMNFEFDTVQVPYYTEGFIKWTNIESKQKWKRVLMNNFVRFISFIVDPLFVHLRKRNFEPIFWVINKDTEFDEVLKYKGVAGIMTDRPEHYIKYLEKKNK